MEGVETLNVCVKLGSKHLFEKEIFKSSKQCKKKK